MPNDPLEIVDASGLTDDDWAKINELKGAYAAGGPEALHKAMEDMRADPMRYVRVLGAFFPDVVSPGDQDDGGGKG